MNQPATQGAADSPANDLQLTGDGRLRHLLTLDGLPRALLCEILDRAERFLADPSQPVIRSTLSTE